MRLTEALGAIGEAEIITREIDLGDGVTVDARVNWSRRMLNQYIALEEALGTKDPSTFEESADDLAAFWSQVFLCEPDEFRHLMEVADSLVMATLYNRAIALWIEHREATLKKVSGLSSAPSEASQAEDIQTSGAEPSAPAS
jgi:hypothetical protein